MGSFRYLLAVLVVASHAHGDIAGYNIGISAVISFFLISGYVMTILIDRHYAALSKVGLFYLDRCARLFPQYTLYLLIALAVLAAIHHPMLASCGPYEIGLNALIFPLDIYQLIGLRCMIIPQAWSLGLELSLYAIIPFLIIYRPLAKWSVAISFGIFALAFFGIISPDTYGYRLLPGTLFIFFAGTAMARQDILWRNLPAGIWIAAIMAFVALHFNERLCALPASKEIVVGLLLGIPALGILRRVRFSKWDEFAGNLSYGVFVSHFVLIFFFKATPAVAAMASE
jgi:peptidoglycan/LPS O-acetylase OafA/YrhL